ncbi:MAG: DUF397 domain-containing protein [Actinobacteria bacterium]|nr:DUF397 domain-containing protein [Actinomycetota bacterium]
MSASSSDVATLAWHKAARSVANGACVEVATGNEVVAVRDSKDPDGPILWPSAARWRSFVAGAKQGAFDEL